MMFLEKHQGNCREIWLFGREVPYRKVTSDLIQTRILPILCFPRLYAPTIPKLWKNNNCESVNKKIKLLGDWHI